jgi:hypothetical protein
MMCVLLLGTLRFEVRCSGCCNSYILTLELRQICCTEVQLLSIYYRVRSGNLKIQSYQ